MENIVSFTISTCPLPLLHYLQKSCFQAAALAHKQWNHRKRRFAGYSLTAVIGNSSCTSVQRVACRQTTSLACLSRVRDGRHQDIRPEQELILNLPGGFLSPG